MLALQNRLLHVGEAFESASSELGLMSCVEVRLCMRLEKGTSIRVGALWSIVLPGAPWVPQSAVLAPHWLPSAVRS